MEHKNVIFSLLDSPAFGGAEKYIFLNLKFLNKNGYEIVLATNNEKVKNEFLTRLTLKEQKTFKIVNAPYRLDAIGNLKGLIKYFLSIPKALVWCFFTIKNLKKSYKNVICLWPGFSDRLSFSFIAYFLNCNLIWIEFGPLTPVFKKNFGFPKVMYNLASYFPGVLITISNFTKNDIIRNSKFKSKDIKIIYPGIKIFTKEKIKKFKIRFSIWQKREKLENRKIICLMGRLAIESEIDLVLIAFSRVIKELRNQNIMLLIIGDGPDKKKYEDLSKNLKIESFIKFVGFVSEEEKNVLLSGCDFFIFPRAWELEGFGMTTIEAMSLGLPVLVPDFGPQREIVTDDKAGFKYSPHNSIDLSLKIIKMLNLNFKEKSNFINKSLKKASNFSEKKMYDDFLFILRELSS